MRFKLIAMDVDGTLLTRERKIGPRTKEALHKAADQGMKIVLCTGRRYRSTLPIIDLLGVRPMVVVNGGALVRHSETGKAIYRNGLPFALADAVLSFLANYDVSPLLFVDAFPNGPDFVIEEDRKGNEEFLRYIQGGAGHYLVSKGFASAPRHKLLEIAVFGPMGSLRSLLHRLRQEFGHDITTHVLQFDRYRHKSDCLEIFKRGTSKWSALSHVAQQFGITDKEIIAVGDDINDLEMIQKAGFGVAMGNAREDLKDAADLVTGTCNEEGIADILEQLFDDE